MLWPTLGNHDGTAPTRRHIPGPYYDIFTLPKRAKPAASRPGTEAYYSFDYGNIHFVCLESYRDQPLARRRDADVAAADLAANTRPWIVAFWHHPPYSKGSHDSDAEIELVRDAAERVPILENVGVDLVLAGHSHSYERS